MTRTPETGVINWLHFSGASFWYMHCWKILFPGFWPLFLGALLKDSNAAIDTSCDKASRQSVQGDRECWLGKRQYKL